MNRLITKTLSLLLSFLLLISFANIHAESIHAESSSAETQKIVPDGEYEIEFRYVADQTDGDSYLETRAIPGTGKLVVQNGTYFFSNEFNTFGAFHAFKSKMAGYDKAVTVKVGNSSVVESGMEGYKDADVTIIEEPDHARLSFEVIDLESRQDILIHVIIEDLNYNNWYNVQLILDTRNLPRVDPNQPGGDGNIETHTKEELAELINVAEETLETVTDGTGDGYYQTGTRVYLEGSISYAKLIAASPYSNTYQVSIAYAQLRTTLDQVALNRISVDRSRLVELLASAQELHSTLKIVGEVLGGPDVSGAVAINLISEGEYPRSPQNSRVHLGNRITQATLLLNDPQSNQQEIDTAYQQLQQYLNALEADRAIRSTIKMAVLDVDVLNNSTVTKSVYEKYFDLEVEHYTSNRLHARLVLRNITELLDEPVSTLGNGRIRASSPPNTGNLKAANGSLGTPQQACPVISYDEENDIVTCQISLITGLVSETSTSGIIQFWFDNTLLDKTVILNFNVEQTDALIEQLEDARQLLNEALNESSTGLYPETAITALDEAIDAASEVAENPIATRNELTAAAQQLEQATTALQMQKVYEQYFTVAHATQDAFSDADRFFLKPAKIETAANGEVTASFTITGGSTIAELKIEKTPGEFEDAEVVDVDEAANTRIVAFRVDDLSQLINAKVRVVTSRGPGEIYDETRDIRFNFNGVDNTALQAAASEATSLNRTAVVGTAPGQYPQAASNALQLALAESGKVATNTEGNQQQTDMSLDILTSAINYFKESVIKDASTPGTPPVSNGPVYPADGKYYMDYRILEDGKESNSMAYDYVVHRALVEVSGGNKTVKFVVKQSNEITYWKLDGRNENVVSRNTANNTRITSFTLPSLSGKLDGVVRIDWYNVAPGLDYLRTYDIQFLFDESTATPVADNADVPGWDEPGRVGVGDDRLNQIRDNDEDQDVETTADEEETGNNTEEAQSENGNDSAPSIVFSDTATHWARSSIEQAVKLGIVNGYSDGSFRPNGIVTRGEFAVMISRALGLEGEGDADALQDFGSIPDWAQAHVARAVAAGIIGGFEDATFRPGGHLTRAQLAAIIARAANLELDADADLAFADTAAIPDWAQQEVAAAVKAGLVQGKDGNRFDPDATATRAEALTLIIRLLELL